MPSTIMNPSITNFNTQEDEQRGSIRPLKRHFVRMKPISTMLKPSIERKLFTCLLGGVISLLLYGSAVAQSNAASAISRVQDPNASAIDIFKGMKYRNI